MSTDKISLVENKLNALHKDAEKDYRRIGKGVVKSIFRPIQPSDFKHAYLPVSKNQGRMLRELIIKHNSKHILEFGTSFGISTIYLADAAKRTGGTVITTELLENKAQRAIENFKEAGLNDYIEVKIGDALETLKGHSKPIDFLFLDGWKDLYLPLFQMLEPQFHSNTLIYADNMNMASTRTYANYVLNKKNVYSTKTVDNGKAFLTFVS